PASMGEPRTWSAHARHIATAPPWSWYQPARKRSRAQVMGSECATTDAICFVVPAVERERGPESEDHRYGPLSPPRETRLRVSPSREVRHRPRHSPLPSRSVPEEVQVEQAATKTNSRARIARRLSPMLSRLAQCRAQPVVRRDPDDREPAIG